MKELYMIKNSGEAPIHCMIELEPEEKEKIQKLFDYINSHSRYNYTSRISFVKYHEANDYEKEEEYDEAEYEGKFYCED